MIRNEKCEVLDKQNFEPKYRRVYNNLTYSIWQGTKCSLNRERNDNKQKIEVMV
jgi:hypothetical protein